MRDLSRAMRCQQFRALLTPYIDGELPLGARQQCEDHLRDCLACREALARSRKLAGLLWELPVPPVPEGVASRVLLAIQATPARQGIRSTPSGWSWRAGLARRAAAVLIFAAGLAVGGWMAGQAVPRAAAGSAPPTAETAALVDDMDYLGGDQEDSLPHVCQTLVAEANNNAP